MMAFVVSSSAVVSPALGLFFLLPILLVLAPQPIRRDRRVAVTVVVLLLVLGAAVRADAAVTGICKYAWWTIECLLFGW